MTFESAVRLILDIEGGYINDSSDPGGETKYGISKRSYPELDIEHLTESQATFIYRRDYWDRCHCDALPSALRLLVFDAAVNQGVSAAIRMLQDAVNVDVDGVIGPKTLEAARRESIVPMEMAARRMVRYAKNANFDRYGLGWARRLMRVAMATAGGL